MHSRRLQYWRAQQRKSAAKLTQSSAWHFHRRRSGSWKICNAWLLSGSEREIQAGSCRQIAQAEILHEFNVSRQSRVLCLWWCHVTAWKYSREVSHFGCIYKNLASLQPNKDGNFISSSYKILFLSWIRWCHVWREVLAMIRPVWVVRRMFGVMRMVGIMWRPIWVVMRRTVIWGLMIPVGVVLWWPLVRRLIVPVRVILRWPLVWWLVAPVWIILPVRHLSELLQLSSSIGFDLSSNYSLKVHG